MTKIDLTPFCATDEERFAHPFSIGAWTYATDRRIAVRVPRRHDVPEMDDPPPIERNFVTANNPLIEPVPFAGPQVKRYETCDSCHGTGGGHDCPHCRCVCMECAGEGSREIPTCVRLGPILIAEKHARLILSLPGVMIETGTKPGKPVRFVFNGGEGVVMARLHGRGMPVTHDLAPSLRKGGAE